MIRITRLAVVAVCAASLLVLSGCGEDKKKKSGADLPAPKLSCELNLNVVERTSSFDKKSVECEEGLIKITVLVPKSAKGKHGVGIDGGVFKDTVGPAVKPGSSSSLTAAVTAGTKYELFDSAPGNRKKGYAVSLKVLKAKK